MTEILLTEKELPCPKCGQVLSNVHGGEYPCPACKLPTLWDDIDPRQEILDRGIDVPRNVLICRYCKASLYASLDDTWIDGDGWGAGTINLDCVSEPDLELDVWEDWEGIHKPDEQTAYQDGLEDEAKVAAWLNRLHPGFKNEC